VALAAGLAALDAVKVRVARNTTERARLTASITAAGLPVALSAANFVWLPVGRRAEALAAHLGTANIATRCFAGEGVRITTGTKADTDAVLDAVACWRQDD